jgi:RHS repeat-associated protein
MTAASKAGTVAQFTYDAQNRCIKRTVNGTATYYFYDGWNLIEERNAADAELQKYIHGVETDEILKKVSPNDTVYYHHDALGDVAALTNKAGSMVEQYTYGAYGAFTIKNGNGDTIVSSAYNNRFLFTGREYLKDIDLYDYRNRMYSYKFNRFLQPDPLRFKGNDYNLYRYAKNNPITIKDALGLCTEGTVTIENVTNDPYNPNQQCWDVYYCVLVPGRCWDSTEKILLRHRCGGTPGPF